VTPARLVRAALRDPSLRDFVGAGPVTLIAAGKAALGMTHGFVEATDVQIAGGVAVGPGHGGTVPLAMTWHTGGHPLPSGGSLAAGQEALGCAAAASPSGCVVVLLSGGASALLAVPVPGLTLEEKIGATRTLLAAGTPIHELNCVRKHLSAIKGGRLAQAAACRMLTLAISDVVWPVEDDPAVIGSGPTVADVTTFADAAAIVRRPGVRDRVPTAVLRALERGAAGELPETLKGNTGDSAARWYRVIGSRRQAMLGAVSAARELGYTVRSVADPVVGEARVAGAVHPRRAAMAMRGLAGPLCVVSSGETTVTVAGRGRGGRNQEFALAAAPEMHRLGATSVLASLGTDGVDGPTDAAGALVDPGTIARAGRLRLAPVAAFLAENDSYSYFDRLGDLIRPGPTGTNVGDLQVVVAAEAPRGVTL
jgi:glycerate 2-kinase